MYKENLKPVNKKDLDGMLQQAIQLVKNMDVDVPNNIKTKVRTYKAVSYAGQCRIKDEQFEITISEYHLNNGYQPVFETMIHEVVHTVDGCWNHGRKWQHIIDKINRKYGYNISTCGHHNLRAIAQSDAKYQIQCTKCKNITYLHKFIKVVQFPELYYCAKCHGTLKRIK